VHELLTGDRDLHAAGIGSRAVAQEGDLREPWT
jgi:hypothetical protein